MLAGWLAASSGLEVPAGPATVVPRPLHLDGASVRGDPTVARARRAERVVAIVSSPDGDLVVSARPTDLAQAERELPLAITLARSDRTTWHDIGQLLGTSADEARLRYDPDWAGEPCVRLPRDR